MSPSLQSIWLAESVVQDDDGQVSVTGIFDTIDLEPGATYARGAVLFFAVWGVHERVTLKLVCVDLADETVIVERIVRLETSPLETTDVTVRINQIPAPHPGVYAWEVFHGEERLGTTRIRIRSQQDENEVGL